MANVLSALLPLGIISAAITVAGAGLHLSHRLFAGEVRAPQAPPLLTHCPPRASRHVSPCALQRFPCPWLQAGAGSSARVSPGKHPEAWSSCALLLADSSPRLPPLAAQPCAAGQMEGGDV